VRHRLILRNRPFVTAVVMGGASLALLTGVDQAAAYSCGDNIEKDAQGHQILVYRNCANHEVRRKADVHWATDGPCITLSRANSGVGDERILVTVYDPGPLNEVYIRGSKAC
jgi:hypothetical protein